MTAPASRTLDEQRAEFARNRFLAMPIAGTIAWSIVTGEDLMGKSRPNNAFDSLFFHTIVMAWLVFAIAIPFFMIEPTSLPLTVGILAGLMWVPFSWMLRHRVGLFHGIARTVLVLVAWYVYPEHRFVAIPAVIVAIYLVTIVLLVKRSRLRISLLSVGVLASTLAHAADAGTFEPARVEVIVVGCPHLKQMNAKDLPPADEVRRKLATFQPDHLVVEWLHPSIDPADTDNYRPFEDMERLAREWGYDLAGLEKVTARTRDRLKAQKELKAAGSTRVELGKLYYLGRDRLNAGYQWWLAERLGADVGALDSLTYDNFAGHELEVWGFPIAQQQGIEYITPFDYQGDDAAWIWMDIVGAVITFALDAKHGLQEGHEQWESAAERFAMGMQAYLSSGDSLWIDEYGDIPEVAELAEVIRIWTERRNRDAGAGRTSGLDQMRYNQSAEHATDTRYMYDRVFPTISLDGLGRKLVDNWLLRNQRMVDFVEADVKRLGSGRVMILVGEGHGPFLIDDLTERGYDVIPAGEFIP